MNLNATLFAQFVVFFILALFTMKFVWPPLIKALDERAKKISEGLEAADRGHAELAFAETRVQVQLVVVHLQTICYLVLSLRYLNRLAMLRSDRLPQLRQLPRQFLRQWQMNAQFANCREWFR